MKEIKSASQVRRELGEVIKKPGDMPYDSMEKDREVVTVRRRRRPSDQVLGGILTEERQITSDFNNKNGYVD